MMQRPTHEELFSKCPHVRTQLQGRVPYCLDCRELTCQGNCRIKCWVMENLHGGKMIIDIHKG